MSKGNYGGVDDVFYRVQTISDSFFKKLRSASGC
jgi:hypothetical protein